MGSDARSISIRLSTVLYSLDPSDLQFDLVVKTAEKHSFDLYWLSIHTSDQWSVEN